MIDSMLFLYDLPAGTYSIGDKVTLNLHTGPAVVRDGLGTPVLKGIYTGALTKGSSAGGQAVRYYVKNSNWNDPAINGPSILYDVTGQLEQTTGYQPGNDCVLQVNSAFEVTMEFFQASTTTVANTYYALIDIEYSSLAGVQNPQGESGIPCSILYDCGSLALDSVTAGSLSTTGWTEKSFDVFKAGYRYMLQKISVETSQNTVLGFMKFSGGASMGGLSRIIPLCSLSAAAGKVITYTNAEVKGPVNVGVLLTDYTGANTDDISLVCDYVKRV